MKQIHKNKLKKIYAGFFTLIISTVFFVSFTGTSIAQNGKVTQPPIIPQDSTDQGKLYIPHDTSGGTNKTYLENQLLPGIATTIIGITGGLALVFVIISGIQMLTSYGNTEAFTKARNTLIYALGGLVVASLSYAIVRIIASINIT